MAEERLTEAQVIDNIIAAAFGNASAGPTAAKALQHLAAGDPLSLAGRCMARSACLDHTHPELSGESAFCFASRLIVR